MKLSTRQFGAVIVIALLALSVTVPASGQEPGAENRKPAQPNQEDMAKMMETAKIFIEPSEKHNVLALFDGKRKTVSRLFTGERAGEPEEGTTTIDWRFLERDKIVMQIHDSAIDEGKNEVVEVVSTRVKEE